MVDVPPFALSTRTTNRPATTSTSRRRSPNAWACRCSGRGHRAQPDPYLLTGKVDMLVAVLGIVPERTKLVLFSEPYAGFANFIYGRKDLPIHSVADLKGLTVAVPRANTTDIMLRGGAEGTNILRFDDDASVRQALLARQVDATSLRINLPDSSTSSAGTLRAQVRPADPGALLQTFAAAEMGEAGERALHQATFGSRRCVINWTTSERADAPSPKARSTRRASPQMSRVMLNAAAWPLRNARITSNPLIVA